MNIQEKMKLTGRVALITGGAGHIGQVIAETLAELGANIVLLDCQKTVNEVAIRLEKKFGVKAAPLLIDLEKSSFIETVLKKIQQAFGRLDILINNAAFVGTSNLKGWAVPFKEQSVETWRRALEVNLTAPFALIQACSDLLEVSKKGSIINIGSIYGICAPDMQLYEGTELGNPAAYGVSKAGLIYLTKWLAANLAPHIRVNAISPGGILREQSKKFIERYVQKTPLKRMATEEDLQGAIAYLASDLSLYVTGQNLIIDGGWTI